jgi:type IV pilus assembly protein PilM
VINLFFKIKVDGALDIGTTAIKGLKLKKNKIEKMTLLELSQGTILNGDIVDYDKFTSRLKEIVELLELKNKNVVISLPVQDFFVKFLNIPLVDDKEKLAMIEGELEELIPNFTPEEFITEYISLNFVGDNEEVIAITINKDKIKNLIEIATAAKISIVKIIPDFVSLYNFLQFQKEKDKIEVEESVMVVDIGAETTKLFIEKGGDIKLQRIIAIGGNDLNDIITRIYNVDYVEAERIKKSLELAKDEYNKESENENDRELFEEIAKLISQLEKQLKVSIEFYVSHESTPGLDKIYITGGGSLIKGFKNILKKSLEIDIDDFSYSKIIMEQFDEIDSAKCISLLGNIIEEVK